jgi:hypothetical protein
VNGGDLTGGEAARSGDLRRARWDPSAGYPFTNCIGGNTPEAFKEALALTKQRLDERGGPKTLNLNCWNEWTEGSYLEPDTRNRMAYLEAVRGVFG